MNEKRIECCQFIIDKLQKEMKFYLENTDNLDKIEEIADSIIFFKKVIEAQKGENNEN